MEAIENKQDVYIVYSAYIHEDNGSVDGVYQNRDEAIARVEEIEKDINKEAWICEHEVR